MKKHLRKIAAMILFVCFIISCMPINVGAIKDEPQLSESKIKINEYEEITQLQSMTDAELVSLGYSSADISEIKSISYREALLERAQMSTTALRNLGYSNQQILFLKEFAKNPDGEYDFLDLENEVDITFDIVSGANSTTVKTIRANWVWNVVPLVAKKDVFAVRWKGVDSHSYTIDLVNYSGSSNRSATVTYYSEYGAACTKSATVSPAANYNSLNTSFNTSITYNGDLVWAKSGSMTFKLQLVNSDNSINYIKVMATYFHRSVTLSGSSFTLSYPADLSISISPEGNFKARIRNANISSRVEYTDD